MRMSGGSGAAWGADLPAGEGWAHALVAPCWLVARPAAVCASPPLLLWPLPTPPPCAAAWRRHETWQWWQRCWSLRPTAARGPTCGSSEVPGLRSPVAWLRTPEARLLGAACLHSLHSTCLPSRALHACLQAANAAGGDASATQAGQGNRAAGQRLGRARARPSPSQLRPALRLPCGRPPAVLLWVLH